MTVPLVIMDTAALRALVLDAMREVVGALPVQPPPASDPALLTADEFAALLRVDERTLRRLLREGAVPPPIRIAGRILRWRRTEIDRWLESGGAAVKKPFHSGRRRASMSPVETKGRTT